MRNFYPLFLKNSLFTYFILYAWHAGGDRYDRKVVLILLAFLGCLSIFQKVIQGFPKVFKGIWSFFEEQW